MAQSLLITDVEFFEQYLVVRHRLTETDDYCSHYKQHNIGGVVKHGNNVTGKGHQSANKLRRLWQGHREHTSGAPAKLISTYRKACLERANIILVQLRYEIHKGQP